MMEPARIQKGGGSVVGQTRGEINELMRFMNASCSIRTFEVDGIGG
jgi:hypothetical protein